MSAGFVMHLIMAGSLMNFNVPYFHIQKKLALLDSLVSEYRVQSNPLSVCTWVFSYTFPVSCA